MLRDGKASKRGMLVGRAWGFVKKWRIPRVVVQTACSFLGRVFLVFRVDRRVDLSR